MNELLQNLIESLRDELKQYGELLALLDQQQKLVLLRQGPDLIESVAAIDAQAEVIRIARHEREQRRRDLARFLGLDAAAGFKELIAHLPPEYRPLVQALVEENNELLRRAQQRARQNHLLLNRAVDLMQRFINSLCPGGTPAAYNHNGQKPEALAAHPQLYDAIG